MSNYRYDNNRNGSRLIRILLFYIIPFLVINAIILFLATTKPKYEVTLADTDDYLTTSFTLKVTSFFPYKDLSVSLDGDLIELEEIGKKTYRAQVYKNGMLEISIKNFNGMPVASFEQINTLDDNSPEVSDQVIEDGILSLHFSDHQSGMDFSSIYAIDAAGGTRQPLSIDKETGFVTFQMDRDGLVIHAKDLAGNELIANCSLSTEHENAADISEQSDVEDSSSDMINE